jgi:hypothetical protein
LQVQVQKIAGRLVAFHRRLRQRELENAEQLQTAHRLQADVQTQLNDILSKGLNLRAVWEAERDSQVAILLQACACDNVGLVCRLAQHLTSREVDGKRRGEESRFAWAASALVQASCNNSVRTLEWLLAPQNTGSGGPQGLGLPSSLVLQDDAAPLRLACVEGCAEAVQLLCSIPAFNRAAALKSALLARDGEALFAVCRKGHVGVMQHLLKTEGGQEAAVHHDFQAFRVAHRAGRAGIVRQLIEAGVAPPEKQWLASTLDDPLSYIRCSLRTLWCEATDDAAP